MRCAPLRPIPGTRSIEATSCVAMARLKSSGVSAPRIDSATFGPIPETVCTNSNSERASSLKNPNSVSESSRTTRDVNSCTCDPIVTPALVAAFTEMLNPTPPTSTINRSLWIDLTVPLMVEIIYPRSLRSRDFSAARAVAIFAFAPPLQI